MAMHRFRRFGKRTFKRRSRADLLPISACQFTASVLPQNDDGCQDDDGHSDTIFAFEQLWGGLPTTSGPSNTGMAFNKLSRGLRFRGMKFQFEIQCPIMDTADVADVLDIAQPVRCAWYKQKLIPDTTGGTMGLVPYVPSLWTNAEADKVDFLWRWQGLVRWRGFDFNQVGTSPDFVSLDFRGYSTTDSNFPFHTIRTRRNLDEDEAIVFQVSIAHPSGFAGVNFPVDIELFGFAAVRNLM